MSLPPQLVERFIGHLAVVEREVAEAEARLTTGGERVEDVEVIRAAAHKLAGTAAAYGFPIVGERAQALQAALAVGTCAGDEMKRQVREFRHALASAVGVKPA